MVFGWSPIDYGWRAFGWRVSGAAGQVASAPSRCAINVVCDAQVGLGQCGARLPVAAQVSAAESKDRVDVLLSPVHSGALAASFHDQLVRAFDDSASDRQPLFPEETVLDLLLTLGQVGLALFDDSLAGGVIGKALAEFCQGLKYDLWFARKQFSHLRVAPRTTLAVRACVTGRVDIATGMTDVEHSPGLACVDVDEQLDPVGAIVYSRHKQSLFDAPAMRLDCRQPDEGRGVRQP